MAKRGWITASSRAQAHAPSPLFFQPVNSSCKLVMAEGSKASGLSNERRMVRARFRARGVEGVLNRGRKEKGNGLRIPFQRPG